MKRAERIWQGAFKHHYTGEERQLTVKASNWMDANHQLLSEPLYGRLASHRPDGVIEWQLRNIEVMP